MFFRFSATIGIKGTREEREKFIKYMDKGVVNLPPEDVSSPYDVLRSANKSYGFIYQGSVEGDDEEELKKKVQEKISDMCKKIEDGAKLVPKAKITLHEEGIYAIHQDGTVIYNI